LVASNVYSSTTSWIKVEAIMFSTNLTEEDSNFVKNEKQTIQISSSVTDESYEIEYLELYPDSSIIDSLGEVQSLTMNQTRSKFMLEFMGAYTALLSYGASASVIEKALNDLPTLQPDLVKVTQIFGPGVLKNYTIEFSADLGNVSNIREVMGQANAEVVKLRQGNFTGLKTYMILDGVTTDMFSLNDSASNVNQFYFNLFL